MPRRKSDAERRPSRPTALRPLGAQLRRLRLDRRLTQEELAERASLNYKYIGRIELGKADPGADVLIRLARALGVPVGDIFDTITPPRTAAPPLPVDDVERVSTALQALTAAIERLLSSSSRPPAVRAPRRRPR